MTGIKMKNAFILLPFLSFLWGCANPYSQFYRDFTGGKNVLENPDVVIPTGEPKIIQGSNIENREKDDKQMMEDGYCLLGASCFNARDIDQKAALEQAKKIHADTVIAYQQYTDTFSGSMPVTLPDTQTSQHSGMISGYGGSAHYFGSSTTYGSKTIYMPYHIHQYDYYASFWVKYKPLGLGIYYDDLTDELRREIGSNKGIRIMLVVKGSPAFDNDLLVGDVIRKFNDIEVIDIVHYQNIIKETKGQQIKLEILRGGKTITKQIQLN